MYRRGFIYGLIYRISLINREYRSNCLIWCILNTISNKFRIIYSIRERLKTQRPFKLTPILQNWTHPSCAGNPPRLVETPNRIASLENQPSLLRSAVIGDRSTRTRKTKRGPRLPTSLRAHVQAPHTCTLSVRHEKTKEKKKKRDRERRETRNRNDDPGRSH